VRDISRQWMAAESLNNRTEAEKMTCKYPVLLSVALLAGSMVVCGHVSEVVAKPDKIEDCLSCHNKNDLGKLKGHDKWVLKDKDKSNKACLACHTPPPKN
jgi:hypothetical protein